MEKILIIDDSFVQATMLKNLLSDAYEVQISRSGRDGVEKAAENRPSLILLDVVMPRWDGFEVLRRLKAEEATQDIPVILITGLADVDNEEKGLMLGAVDYIIKPFNALIVRARVRTHIQLYRYRKTFEDLALLDGLTGIPNRRSYDERSAREWERAVRERSPLSIGLLDIDFFKQYNDRYGHPRGDDVLCKVARCVSGRLRSSGDFVGRYGGEEFVLLLPNTPAQHGARVAREICAGVEALQIPHEDSRVSGFVTVSIGGMTLTPSPEDGYADSFKTVDEMLYRAKSGGRNRVVWAE